MSICVLQHIFCAEWRRVGPSRPWNVSSYAFACGPQLQCFFFYLWRWSFFKLPLGIFSAVLRGVVFFNSFYNSMSFFGYSGESGWCWDVFWLLKKRLNLRNIGFRCSKFSRCAHSNDSGMRGYFHHGVTWIYKNFPDFNIRPKGEKKLERFLAARWAEIFSPPRGKS